MKPVVPVVSLLALLLSTVAATAGTLVQFRTTLGEIDVELYDADKPVTVQNFLRYIQTGRYTNAIMHRAVTNFVIQGGGFFVVNSNTVGSVPAFPPITNEFKVGTLRSNVYGTIAMAKTSDPNSATCQFFFNLADNSASLDNTNNAGGFTVFGHVVGGTNILNRFNPGPANTFINLANFGSPFAELPILKPATAATFTFNDFLYLDISILKVQVTVRSNRSREISWLSSSNYVNYVEFTTNLPPTWQTLISTNGNGGPMKAIDSSSNNSARFYRVRVAY